MTQRSGADAVFVETAARLHLGVLDLRGARGRWFGGIGTAAPAPTLLLSASAADVLQAEGEDAERAAAFAARFLAHHGIGGGARLRVHRALPRHVGLGSGTQLAMAVARALATLHGIDTDPPALARAVGRGQRSAVGTWTFAGGGLVVEGGRLPEREDCGPLLARLPFPPAWRCVVAVPDGTSGFNGESEAAAFDRLEAPPEHEVEHVAHLVLMSLLPALADADIEGFGAALTAVQEITGRWFAPVQGGTFAPGLSEELVRRMSEWGASGVGQSSWGPAVYGIVADCDSAVQLADRVRGVLGTGGTVYEGAFPIEGARVWRGDMQGQ
ncbi:MAG: beta-ribofuranosylaminobenzene 5'-phosphate synthase family protein [Vicinamibacterales bacterium]